MTINPNELLDHDERVRQRIKAAHNPSQWPGPIKYVHEFLVMTHDSRSGFHGVVGSFITRWKREAREIATNRSEASGGLPIYEVGPQHDPYAVLRRAPDGVYIFYQVRREFGDIIRDGSGGFDTDELFAKRALPLLKK